MRGGVLGQALAGLGRAELLRVGEGRTQQIALRSIGQIIKREVIDPLDRVRPVGVNADAVCVRRDQERRVFKRDGILQKLREGPVEVFLRPLVLPCEMALAPDIGPALAG
ncbi:MAG: hypothetical protein JJU08_14955 [Rhodobacteraceae bacterium]|nr:hypothetical protein [Paracoccaceae bacterium]